jgi:metal transporter CNNM
MPLLGILDKFQEGKSHMAIVSRFSADKAASVKKAVKRGLTQRLRERVGIGEGSDEDGDANKGVEDCEAGNTDTNTLKGDGILEKDFANIPNGKRGGKGRTETARGRGNKRRPHGKRAKNDLEMGVVGEEPEDTEMEVVADKDKDREKLSRLPSYVGIPMPSMGLGTSGLEQSMPADAVLAKKGADEVNVAPFSTMFVNLTLV